MADQESRIYGHDGTIHQTTHLDVEVDSEGVVQTVWFRCMMLPFKVSVRERAPGHPEVTTKLIAVEVEE